MIAGQYTGQTSSWWREANIHPKIETISVKYPKTSLEPLETLIKASKQKEADSARA